VDTAVDAAMGAAGLTGYTTTSDISTLTPTDMEVTVSVSIPLSRVSFTAGLLGGGSFDIGSTTTMRREGLN
jgi:hypothetical protein